MKSKMDLLIYLFAAIGLCAVVYGGWHIYQEHVALEQQRAFFGSPPSSIPGMPDAFHDAPPPHQP